MNKPKLINRLVEVYRSVALYPTISSGFIFNRNSNGILKIQSNWAQKNLERKEIVRYRKLDIINIENDEHYSSPPVDVTSEKLSRYSGSEKFLCILREIISTEEFSQGSKKKQLLEIWNEEFLLHTFNIDEFDIHGSIYFDDEFGALEWSPDETKILYIAEKKFPKSEPFYKQGSHESKGKSNESPLFGEEYVYTPTWGEQLSDKHQPVVCVCDTKEESLKVLEGIPSNFSPGQVIWSKNGEGVYGIVLENEPRRLGLTYCTNRKGYIFYLSLDGKFEILSEENRSVRSPRLSREGDCLYWLQRAVNGPHDGAQELVRYNIVTRQSEIIIPVIRKPLDFCGIYAHDLPKRCFSSDGKKLFFSTINKTIISSYYVDLEKFSIKKLPDSDNVSVLDVNDDMILGSTSSFLSTPALIFSKSITCIKWVSVTDSKQTVTNSVVEHIEFNAEKTEDYSGYFNALYVGPDSSVKKKIPLIVCPHGGPHSCIADSFSFESSFYLNLGFGLLFVNFRGSTGAGEDSVNFLLGKIGNTDVSDVHFGISHILMKKPYIDAKKVVLLGGSHGGFLVTLLSAKYPDMFKAVVSRNPVINVFTMYSESDIPDWVMTESGLVYNELKLPKTDEAAKMLEVSPIYHSHNINTPTYFMLGKKDLRVPYNQGLSLYYILKARRVKTKLNLYDDNHSLQKVPVHFDSVINGALWFIEHLGLSEEII